VRHVILTTNSDNCPQNFVMQAECCLCAAGTEFGFGVPWLRGVVTGLSLRRQVFDPRPVVDTVALAQSFLT